MVQSEKAAQRGEAVGLLHLLRRREASADGGNTDGLPMIASPPRQVGTSYTPTALQSPM